MLLSYQIENIILLPFDVFPDAYVDTAIFVISKEIANFNHVVSTYVYGKREKLKSIELSDGKYRDITQEKWAMTEDKKFVLNPETIKLLEQIRQRISISFDKAIQIKRGVLFDKSLLTTQQTSPKSHPYFEGDVYRYELNSVANHWIEFDDRMKERPKEFIWFNGPRILLRRLVNRRQRLMATFATETFITNKNLYSVLPRGEHPKLHAILGVLNSRLISYLYISQVTQATKDDFPQVTIKDVLALPFPEMDKARHDKMVELVQQMLDLHKQLADARVPQAQTLLQRQIDATDRQIDRLVYALYGLTEEEIQIVESAG